METGPSMSSPGSNPYVGPRTFTRQESHLFFGRESESRDLLNLVISEHLVLFYAQSGAGKSSLVNARLIPGLEHKGFEVLPVGRVSGALLAENDVENVFVYNLLLSLDQSKRDPERFAKMAVVDFLANLVNNGKEFIYDDNPAPAAPTIPAAPGSAPVEIWPRALIIDQFEELFTTHPEAWEKRTDFFKQLAVAMDADPYLWVVLTMREDHVAALDPYAYLLPGKLRARYYMQRMGSQAALEAVSQPVANLRPFASGVADLLVDNLRLITTGQSRGDAQVLIPGEFIEPVQLQVVCYQLWENLQSSAKPGAPPQKEITRDDLARLTKGADLAEFVNNALADFYEQAITRVLQTPGVQVSERELREWFATRLITESETRGFIYQGEEKTGGLPNPVVALLAAQYVIRSDSKASGIWFELVHDRFIIPILQSNRKWQANHLRPLTQAAEAWRSADKDRLKLYDGNQLKQAKAESDPAELSELEKEFLDASLKADQGRRSFRQRIAALGAVVLFIILASLTGWALTQQNQANKQAAGALQQVFNQQTIIPMFRQTIEVLPGGGCQAGRYPHIPAYCPAELTR